MYIVNVLDNILILVLVMYGKAHNKTEIMAFKLSFQKVFFFNMFLKATKIVYIYMCVCSCVHTYMND